VNLGIIYYDGLGVNHNKQEALKWLKMAAAQGDEQAIQFINTILSD
jgi:TPR repeat protein